MSLPQLQNLMKRDPEAVRFLSFFVSFIPSWLIQVIKP